ncbi:MAG: hypothetical protein II811_05275 [Spirochaetaceae bacterium]|nr:hypothetical protein [Spirochaetaceae bacterium]
MKKFFCVILLTLAIIPVFARGYRYLKLFGNDEGNLTFISIDEYDEAQPIFSGDNILTIPLNTIAEQENAVTALKQTKNEILSSNCLIYYKDWGQKGLVVIKSFDELLQYVRGEK